MPRLRTLALIAATALLATACATGGGTDPVTDAGLDIRPFEDIQDSEITFEADPLDTSRGIFRVTTTIPTICAIVWGETDEFGRFNNSLAMSGTGIEQHDVVLPDLEQGVEYQYVLQGSGPDGTFYQSDVMTFTIPVTDAPEAAAEPDLGPNLAVGATVVDVSSEFNDAFAGANAVDGDLATEWSSRGDGDEGSITIDLGAPTDLAGVAFLTRSMADGSAITETFAVTVDGGETFGPFPAGSPSQARIAELTATGQVLEFRVDASTGGNVGAVEVQVFGG